MKRFLVALTLVASAVSFAQSGPKLYTLKVQDRVGAVRVQDLKMDMSIDLSAFLSGLLESMKELGKELGAEGGKEADLSSAKELLKMQQAMNMRMSVQITARDKTVSYRNGWWTRDMKFSNPKVTVFGGEADVAKSFKESMGSLQIPSKYRINAMSAVQAVGSQANSSPFDLVNVTSGFPAAPVAIGDTWMTTHDAIDIATTLESVTTHRGRRVARLSYVAVDPSQGMTISNSSYSLVDLATGDFVTSILDIAINGGGIFGDDIPASPGGSPMMRMRISLKTR